MIARPPKEFVLPPSGKRKHKIIFRAVFSDDKNINKELEDFVAMYLGKSGMFD